MIESDHIARGIALTGQGKREEQHKDNWFDVEHMKKALPLRRVQPPERQAR